MTTFAVPLRSIAQQIEQHESELERLRQTYQTRQTELAELRRRREELEAQLHQVDTEIEAVEGAEASEASNATRPAPIQARPLESSSLSTFLTTVLKEVAQPMTIKQLAEEVERRKFPTKSNNIYHLVQNRVQKMAKKEVLDRAEGQGYVLAQASKGKALAHPKAAQPAKKNPPAKSSAASTSPRPQLNGRKDQPSARKNLRNKPSPRPDSHGRTAQPTLRMVLLDLLKKSKHHVAGSELAQQVLKTGYRTSSRNFTDVVWVMLGKMDEVEHLPGKGYRLKKRSR